MKGGVDYPSLTAKIVSSCTDIYVTTVISMDRRRIIHVMMSAGKGGGCASAHLTTHANKISHALSKSDDDRLETFIEMTGILCHQPECCINKIGHYLLKMELKEVKDE